MRVGLENPSERPPGALDGFSSPSSVVRAVKAPQGDAPRLSGKEEVTGAPQPSVSPGARARGVRPLVHHHPNRWRPWRRWRGDLACGSARVTLTLGPTGHLEWIFVC